MILSSEETPDFVTELTRLSAGDPFACRILSLYHSYHPALAFVDYWMTTDAHGVFTGAIARNGSNFLLLLTPESDLEEISSFMRVSGATGILLDGSYRLDCPGKETTGVVMRCSTATAEKGEADFCEPAIQPVYELIVQCAGDGFTPPAFEDFYVDVNHKLRHGTLRLVGVSCEERLAAAAMTVAECSRSAVLGAVACHPAYRRRGCGSAVVRRLVNALTQEGKTVFLHRAAERNAAFYQQLGFTDCGIWREIVIER